MNGHGNNVTTPNGYGVSWVKGAICRTQIKRPSKKIHIGDGGNVSTLNVNIRPASTGTSSLLGNRHNSGANILWGDGHASWESYAKVANDDTYWTVTVKE